MVSPSKKTLSIVFAALFILAALAILFRTLNPHEPDWVSAQVERGNVAEVVSVSGFIEAKNTAELAFPASGVVTEVFAYEGMEVREGDVLATLASAQLVAQRSEAIASLQAAQARYNKLVAGADSSDKTIAELQAQNAELELARTISEERQKVENARTALLSDDLQAYATDPDENATAPTVSGTYTCQNEGTYTLETYSSNAFTGYSYQFSGLEEGIATVSTDQQAPIGSCGVFLHWSDDASYHGSVWQIEIPNTRSSSYIANENAYKLALESQANAVGAAEDARDIAVEKTHGVLDGARTEEVAEARANVEQAQAGVAQINALLQDRSIVAPFDGVVTDVEIVKGETAFSSPVITVLAQDAFTLKVRVPEIDITKLKEGQAVTAWFDARSEEALRGSIEYISPLAVVIDGVAYFEATIQLETTPEWIRSGLNADVDIIVAEKSDALRIPKRFLITNEDGSYSVRTARGSAVATTTVRIDFFGNDGYVEVIGLNEGDTVVAP